MYLVKAKVAARITDISGSIVNLGVGESALVPDKDYKIYENNPAAWTIVAGASAIETVLAAVNNADAPGSGTLSTLTGLSVSDKGTGSVHTTTLTLTDVALAVTDVNAYASQQLYTFPAGRILLLGAIGYLQFGVTSDRTTTINNSASLTWGLGNSAASNKVLSAGMVDQLPKATRLLDGVADAYAAVSNNALAASAQFDGTSTNIKSYLNVGFETDTDIDADGALKVSGTIKLVWINIGDY